MVITSASNRKPRRKYGNSQFHYALVYVCITSVVLLFLNIYCSRTSQQLFCQSKKAAMVEKCQLAAADIANLEVLNTSNVSAALSGMESLRINRLLVTDHAGVALYDSYGADESLGNYVLLPEVIRSMEGNLGQNVFSWEYSEGVMLSRVAAPIVSGGRIMGCVYMLELDTEQGALMKNLQVNILSISLALEGMVILFTVIFATGISRRMRRILISMRIIRSGDYTHRIKMGGNNELTALADEANQLTERLQNSENTRAQFVSDASHELKTPLASIKLLTDSILQNDMDPDTVREFASDIGNEADRLTRMTHKLLSLTKVDTQNNDDCQVVLLRPTIERVVRMLTGLAEQKQVKIELDYKEDSPILIMEDDLYQILFNLVENGIKYNRDEGKLRIRTARKGSSAVVQITDTGIGIPRDAIEHIFERFYRVDKARSRSTGGSGLGLAIVRSMVEQNKGTIRVRSTPGKGSVFTVTFPVYNVKEDGV